MKFVSKAATASLALMLMLTACSAKSPVPEDPTATIDSSAPTQTSEPEMSFIERFEAKHEAKEEIARRNRTEPGIDESYAALRTPPSGAIDHSSLVGLLESWVNKGVALGNCQIWNEAFHPEVRIADCESNERLLIEDMALAGIKYEDVENSGEAWSAKVSQAGIAGTYRFPIPKPQNIDGKWYFVEPLSTVDLSERMESNRTFADEQIGNTSPYSPEGFEQGIRPKPHTGQPKPSTGSTSDAIDSVIDHSSIGKFVASWVENALIPGDCDAWNQALSPDLNPVDCTGISSTSFADLRNAKLNSYVDYSSDSNGITWATVKISGSSEAMKFSLYNVGKVDGQWFFTAHPELKTFAKQALRNREYIDSQQP